MQICAAAPFSVGGSCLKLEVTKLSPDWRAYPAPASTRDLGTAWVKDAQSVVLALPSALVPTETNYLVNPAHPDFSQLHIGNPEDFHFDSRLIKGT